MSMLDLLEELATTGRGVCNFQKMNSDGQEVDIAKQAYAAKDASQIKQFFAGADCDYADINQCSLSPVNSFYYADFVQSR